jgi:hypothetical protein
LIIYLLLRKQKLKTMLLHYFSDGILGCYKIPNRKELDDDLHGPRVRNISDPTDLMRSRTEALLDSA